jgi:hypothetical protein
VSEGLASYFGYTLRDKAGEFKPGRIGGKTTALLRGGSNAAPGEASARLREFKKAVKAFPADEGPYIDAFLASVADPRGFYGEDLVMNYTISWVLAHYLLHGDDGGHRDGFVRYMKAESRGQGGREVLYREIGMDADALGVALQTHVKKMK